MEALAQLTFFIPTTLTERAPAAASSYACLETLLARGSTGRSALTHDALLLALFGGESAVGMAPRAAVSHFAQYGPSDAQQWRIIATPVHLLADQATLHLINHHRSLLSDEESRALMASCQEHFAEEGWHLDYGDENTWYLQLSHATDITTTSPQQAAGRPLFEQLPQGGDARIWRRWGNEVQMLLHTHPVNEARRGRSQPLINSLWFWGEGRLPAVQEQRFDHVLGGDPFVQGLAQLSGARWSPLPQGLAALDEAQLEGPTLMVLDESGSSRWDEQWFCPLQKKVRHNAIRHVALHFSSGHATQLTSAMLWRLWRRKRLAVATTGADS